MARTRNQTPVTTPITVDAVDLMVSKLNEINGLDFARDAWENKAPNNYGVVELQGTPMAMWADGHLIDQGWRIRLTIYVAGGSDAWVQTVQGKLDELDDQLDLIYSLPEREYAYDINKVRWAWDVTIFGPLEWTEEVVVQSGTGNG